jgi:hypothetical protein
MKTKEEVNEKFKEANVYFSRYYKYTFTFVCQSEDGYKLICNYGGDSNEIYRYEVSNSPEPFVECDNWSRVRVLDSNDKEVFSESFDW